MASEPPIVEVAITLHFPALVGMTALDIAELFRRFGGAYRTVQHAPSLPPMNVTGGTIHFVENDAEMPRTMFVSEDLRYVFQVQSDRIGFNWRRVSPQHTLEYPRYAAILQRFKDEAATFETWVFERFGTALGYNAGELNFVNAIGLTGEDGPIRLSKIFSFVAPTSQRKISQFAVRWTEMNDLGPINLMAGVGGMPDGQPAATLQLQALRQFDSASKDVVLDGLDEMRPHLHAAFESSISREFWGREP